MPKVSAGKTASLHDAFPVYSYEENKVIFKDGRVAVGFKVEAAEMERWDQDGFASAWVGFQTALKNLPVGCVVQKTDVYYDRPYVHPPAPGQYFTQRMGDYFGNRLVLYYEGYVFLSFAPLPVKKNGQANMGTKLKTPRPTSGLNALINKAEDILPPSVFATVSASLAEAERYASEFMQALLALPDVKLTRLDENQIRLLYLQFMNLEFDSQPQHYEREILNETGTIAVGELKVSCISMLGQGTQVHPCVTNSYGVVSPMVYPLTNFLLVPHIFTQSIQIQDTKTALADLDLDRRLNSGLARFGTQDNEIRMAEIEMFSAEVRAEGKQLCLLHVSVLVWETSDKLRKQNLELALFALRSLYSSEAAVESWLTLPIFFGTLPGNGYQVPDRWLPTTTDRAACYFHWTQSYRSTRTGEYICDRFRNLKRVNLFDLSQDNQNSITIGPSGSGKSYTMGNFIIQRFENKARQIIIDVGGSYRNVCQALTGNDFVNTYFEYDPQNPIEFNPFFLPRSPVNNHWLYPDEKVTFHLSLLGTLWKGGGALDKAETVVLARYLREYYAYLNAQPSVGHFDEQFPGMNSFFQYVFTAHNLLMTEEKRLTPAQLEDADFVVIRDQYLKDIKYVEMNNFFLVVRDYADGGRYEKVLNAKRDVDLSEYPLICFDMARVKGDPTLYPVVAMLITELSLDLFRKFPDDVKYILMDEAWSMLSGTLAEFIENMYRTIRKTKGSIGIITQGIKEITDSAIGIALIDNSATKIILRHDSEAPRSRLQNPLGFTPQDMALIGSIRSGRDYREFFIKQGQMATIFTLEASPQLNAILTSRPTERNYLNKLIKHYQRARPQLVLDHRGQPKLDAVTRQPQYTTVYEQQLEFAVDAFVESGGVEPVAGLESGDR